jgi:hypothetical protein
MLEQQKIVCVSTSWLVQTYVLGVLQSTTAYRYNALVRTPREFISECHHSHANSICAFLIALILH